MAVGSNRRHSHHILVCRHPSAPACQPSLILRERDVYKRQVPNALMGNIFAQLNMPDSAFAYYDRALIIELDYGYANLQKAYLYNLSLIHI